MGKRYLKGFSEVGYIPVTEDTSTAYKATGVVTKLPGAQSCAPTDNREDFTIYADDGVYDSGSEWTSTTLAITAAEMSLDDLGALGGCDFEMGEELMEEGTFDNPIDVALTFAALRGDGGYRLFRYYSTKCTGYKITHTTKGQSKDAQTYELTFTANPRKIDGKIRGTKDIEKGDSLTWLDTVPQLPAAIDGGETGDEEDEG